MENMMEKSLAGFKRATVKLSDLKYADGAFFWDALTEGPASGSERRSRASGTLNALMHEILVNDQMKKDLEILNKNKDKLEDLDVRQVELLTREYKRISNIPVNKYSEYNQLVSKSQIVWEDCKKRSDFATFKPYLEKIMGYLSKFAEYRGYEGHPYNLFLDDYEEGMTAEKLDRFFGEVKEKIIPLSERIAKKNKNIPTDFLSKRFPVKKQEEISRKLLGVMGFDLSEGVLKESEHPFTIAMDIKDVRLTTHYYENDFKSAFLSTAHEGGHALYEQNIDKSLSGSLLATGVSMGIHESQSRIYENNFILSKDFLSFFYPTLKEQFPDQFKGIELDEFHMAMNKTQPSLIRIEADELTYCLHVIIRYEIEQGMIDGSIPLEKLPEIWNGKVKDYLGLDVPEDSKGVLQDTHWAAGLFGYFPTYALGSALSAQLENYMKKDLDVSANLRKGEFSEINNWMREKIQRHGSMIPPEKLVKKVLGEPLNPKYYCDYLEKKYSEIYNL